MSTLQKYIQQFDFKNLFLELGWDSDAQHLQIALDDNIFTLSSIAEKRGVQILICPCEQIPQYLTRQQIEKKLTELVYKHLIIFFDTAQTIQIWQWVARTPHKPTAYREYTYHTGQSSDALIQKLAQIAFTLDEEEALTLTTFTKKLKDTFDKEKVTKRFYDQFKKEHAAFLAFIQGIPDDEMRRWYASVMINRLMFIYFIQYKGFLHHPQFPDDDYHYLRQQLPAYPQRNYYRDFLTTLFFDGFAKPIEQRTPGVKALIGDIPYLNGSLFILHQIEEKYGEAIDIPNSAFRKLFDFFDQWHWHLDDNPIKNNNEINPDMLGYIFEKYINQKQMGAYYTKEDITEYISKNTIIPYLFTLAQQKCQIAFQGENSVWQLLQAEPDRYIYPAVRHGVTLDLPAEIAVGIENVSKRSHWNKLAPAEYALPTEIWREVVARRLRYAEVRDKLARGEIHDINDFITYNLDMRQFAQDVIETAEGTELVRAFWVAIVGRVPEKSNQSFQQGVTILDPTCGSGAFLFAALEILEPLYEACLERMAAFVEDFDLLMAVSKKKRDTKKFSDFRQLLKQVADHPNRRYFILKSIIVHNLYGVDIMEDAVEIAKLRLFLKLVAQVEKDSSKDNFGIEPLPDVDFNIRAGNTLVGFATYEEVQRAVSSQLDFGNALARISEAAGDVNSLFEAFRRQQILLGGEVMVDDKRLLREKLAALETELNRYLAKEYGVDAMDKVALSQWQNSHKPFHWFIEFYGIIKNGGFDVVIGNPPYVQYHKVKKYYSVANYNTENCGNLYALIMERSYNLLTVDNSKKGQLGVIIPVSSISGESYENLAQIFFRKGISWISSFSNRSAKLFYGVEQRLVILLKNFSTEKNICFSTFFQHWYEKEREVLFHNQSYFATKLHLKREMPYKIGSAIAKSILDNVLKNIGSLSNFEVPKKGQFACFYHDGPTYWIRTLPFEPNPGIKSSRSNHYHAVRTVCYEKTLIVTSILNSSIFYWFFKIISNCRDFGVKEFYEFPLGKLSSKHIEALNILGQDLEKNLSDNAKQCFRTYPSGKIFYEEYYPVKAKPIIDEIDRILAQHYGFTDEELDFIINYDIKYRMGKEAKD